MTLIKFLNYPYPFYENTVQGLKICFSIGLFIGAFCYFFQPFGLDAISDFKRLGYGLVSLVVCLFYIVLLPLIFNNYLLSEKWKIYKEIVWVSIITISLATANYFYTVFAFKAGYTFDLNIFILVLTYTAVIAIIPAITIILYKQLFVFKKVIKEVKNLDSQLLIKNHLITQSNKKITIESNSKKDTLVINLNDLITLVSAGNYIEVYFYNDDHVEKKLIRNNISKIEKQLLNHSHIFRCHRSYIINVDYIKKINGNLQGYQLHFDDIDFRIPVSRSFTKKLKGKLLNKK